MPAPRRKVNSRLSVGATGQATPVANVTVRIEGVEKTTADFKRARAEINQAMRDAQEQVGQRVVLPLLRARMAPYSVTISGGDFGGQKVPVAGTLKVQRDRLDVYIGSTLRGTYNRALGWLDFGGKRPRDRVTRTGPLLMVRTLDERQPQIRATITDAVLDQFRRRDFDVS